MKAAGRPFAILIGLALFLLSVLVNGAFAGLESVVVPSKVHSVSDDEIKEPSPDIDAAKACILNYFNDQDSSDDKKFHVQGWRWHTMTLARDAKRLGALASRLAESGVDDDESLEKAVYHVIEFNMRALHRIENKTFFPWLRTQLTSVNDSKLANAFSVMLDEVVENQRIASEIGSQVMDLVDIVYSPNATEAERKHAVDRIVQLASDLCSRVQHILAIEDLYLVPVVAIVVPSSKQRAFNNKVIMSMGVFDSRIHLVGMHETVLELDEAEQALFQQEIPAIPRYMIPRWKRLLYDPQASVLEVSQ